jgi:hypothetical protein
LVPIDFSKMSIDAIETAKGLGQRFNATVHLAHVHHWQYPGDFVGPVISSGFLPESFEVSYTLSQTDTPANDISLALSQALQSRILETIIGR